MQKPGSHYATVIAAARRHRPAIILQGYLVDLLLLVAAIYLLQI